LLHGLNVRYIARQLTIIKGQPGSLTKQKSQIDLRKPVMFLVSALFDLAKDLRVAGDGGDVKGPVFFLYSSLPCLMKKFILFSSLMDWNSSLLLCDGMSSRLG